MNFHTCPCITYSNRIPSSIQDSSVTIVNGACVIRCARTLVTREAISFCAVPCWITTSLHSWESGWLSGYLSSLPPLLAGVQLWPLATACIRAEFQSISTWLEGFSPGTPVFLPHQNQLTANKHLAVVLCSDINMDCIAAARGAFVCFQPDIVSHPS